MRRLFLILPMLLLAPELRAASAPAATCLSELSAQYQRIQSESVDPVDARALVMASLSGLAATHPAVTLAEPSEQLALSLNGSPAGSWPLPADGTDKAALDRWMDLMAAVIDAARPEIGDDAAKWQEVCRRMLAPALRAAHPHSSYVSDDSAACRFGLGIDVEPSPAGPRVTEVIPGTPAARGDIRAGDIVGRIDNEDIGTLAPTDARKRLCGSRDQAIRIELTRDGQTLSKLLEQANLPTVGTVRDHMRGTVLVVAISALTRQTATDLQAALARGRAAGMTALVLDLRHNPGGLLDQVAAVTDQFVDQGPLLSVRARRPENSLRVNARPGALGLPVAVVVDGSTANGAEAVAAILQERASAGIIGTTTPGRGEIATVIPTPGFLGGYIRLVTGSLETPSGRPIGGRGVLPDLCTAGGTVRPLRKEAVAQCPPEDHGDSAADIDVAVEWLNRP